jgi:hypothetical protein
MLNLGGSWTGQTPVPPAEVQQDAIALPCKKLWQSAGQRVRLNVSFLFGMKLRRPVLDDLEIQNALAAMNDNRLFPPDCWQYGHA